jgi:FixJ family two-component response regulator
MRPGPLVLVVDDDPAALDSVGALLASFEYEVRAFASAEDLLTAGVEAEADCLLCDVRLPGMNGLELQKTLRLKGINIPVILVSGYADSDIVAEATDNGAAAVLEKPIDPRALIEIVQTAIEMSKRT